LITFDNDVEKELDIGIEQTSNISLLGATMARCTFAMSRQELYRHDGKYLATGLFDGGISVGLSSFM
jgi:hypothetical protein